MKANFESKDRPNKDEATEELQTEGRPRHRGGDSNTVAKQRIREHRDQILKTEFEQLLTALDLTPRQAALVCLFARRLARQLTAGPVRKLDNAEDPELGHTATALFCGDETS